MSQYTIIYKYGKRTRQLKIFPQETMAAGENRFAPELNEKEVIELLENATLKLKLIEISFNLFPLILKHFSPYWSSTQMA